jgi:hypothetical protein
MGFSLVDIIVQVIIRMPILFVSMENLPQPLEEFRNRTSFPEFNQLREEGGRRVPSLSYSCHTWATYLG